MASSITPFRISVGDDVLDDLTSEMGSLQKSLSSQKQRRAEVTEERNKLNLDNLAEQRRMSESRIRKLAIENYARVLKQAMAARQA